MFDSKRLKNSSFLLNITTSSPTRSCINKNRLQNRGVQLRKTADVIAHIKIVFENFKFVDFFLQKMADNNQDTVHGSSQESLPLSQETFDFLWDEIQSTPPVHFESSLVLEQAHCASAMLGNQASGYLSEAAPVELVEEPVFLVPKDEVTSSSIPYVPSSLPASQNWGGPYNFDISFKTQEKNTKTVTWTYSKLKDKLYVRKDCPCPISFSADISAADNIVIRAMALYGSPEHASEIVHRCVNHSLEELTRNVFEAEHLVRCESNMAGYEKDSTTQRHSVIVPFEVPPVGQHYSTYIYKFACFGSCAGGPNRRPIMLIFSLEKDGQVVGRRKLDVKICACPGRDRKGEEQQMMPTQERTLPKKKRKINLEDTFEFTRNIFIPPKKKTKHSHDRIYTIQADDQEQYEFLVNMKTLFKINKRWNNCPENIKRILSSHFRSKDNQDG
ncbi:hypothetical protein JTE90_006599 [Oedothorax gibbosus]|uniref:Cellular tumor antigen p53 n=1 Tax=Oedothorax gibbosus TaxID=931172 RepID=A0AAV6U4V3_9ARAC|nr:hypothetical protein JTE90_006599 [Oedothorax gibbosus]